MQYSLEKISTVPACDALLTQAQKKQQTLVRKRRNLGEAIDIFRQRMDKLHQESERVRLTLEIFTTAYLALPEGKDKAEMKVKVKRLELRQAQLEKMAYTYNVASLLVREMKYNYLDSQVTAMAEYITIVEQRKAALSLNAEPVGQDAHRAFAEAIELASPVNRIVFSMLPKNARQRRVLFAAGRLRDMSEDLHTQVLSG